MKAGNMPKTRKPMAQVGGAISAIAVGTAALVALLPFIMLGPYCQPAADDYQYAQMVSRLGFVQSQLYNYQNWNGRFFSTAINTLFAAHGMGTFYWLVPLLSIFGLFFAIWRFVICVAGRTWKDASLCVGALAVLAVYALHVPSPAEAFYWLSASVNYQFGNTIALLCLSIIIRPPRLTTSFAYWRQGTLASLLGIAAVGSNEILMVFCVYLQFLLTLSAYLLRRRDRHVLLVVFGLTVAAGIVVYVSPGNAIRSALFPGSGNLSSSVLAAFSLASRRILAFALSLDVIALAVFCAILGLQVRRQPGEKPPEGSKLLLLTPLFYFGMIFLGFFVCYWATAGRPIRRTLNCIDLFILLGWLTTVYCIAKYVALNRRSVLAVPHQIHAVAVVLLVLGLFVPEQPRFWRVVGDASLRSNFLTAWNDWQYRGAEYLQQHNERYATMERARARGDISVRLPSLVNVPMTIHCFDVDEDPTRPKNRAYAAYFGLESVWTDVPVNVWSITKARNRMEPRDR